MQAGLVLSHLSKTFNKELLFKGLHAELLPGSSTAITGHNGSGKSTLLKIIAGLQLPSEGSVQLTVERSVIAAEEHYRYIAYAAPYVELLEEYTLTEMLTFYFGLKPLDASVTLEALPELLLLPKARHKEIRSFSSGMKQRVKLGLAFFTDNPLLLLDEPTSHLDEEGKSWYHHHIARLLGKRTLVIASNEEEEIVHCTQRLRIADFL